MNMTHKSKIPLPCIRRLNESLFRFAMVDALLTFHILDADQLYCLWSVSSNCAPYQIARDLCLRKLRRFFSARARLSRCQNPGRRCPWNLKRFVKNVPTEADFSLADGCFHAIPFTFH